jgi:hypothetical protein
MDDTPSNPYTLVTLLYALAALFAIVGGAAWFQFELRRSRRAKAGLPFHASDMSSAITLTALAMILAGSGFLLGGLI